MVRLNTRPKNTRKTHEGAVAAPINAEQELRRSVLATMLWEDQFYEDGEDIADRVVRLAKAASPSTVAALAIEAREEQNLRHIPLLLLSVLAKTGSGTSLVSETIGRVIQRADELGEFLVVHAKLNGTTPDKIKPKLSKQIKLGLAKAMRKFDEYQLAKYDRAGAVRLRDILFLAHPKPKDDDQQGMWNRLVADQLEPADTWERRLSTGENKQESFTDLIRAGKLGYMALLRNLRKMTEEAVDPTIIKKAILARKGGAHRVLPFRFVSAAKHAPKYEAELDQAMVATMADWPKLPGKTIIVVDVSGSMYAGRVSAKSEMDRMTAAAVLGAYAREICEDPVVYATAGNDYKRVHATKLVPSRHGMALVEAIAKQTEPLGGGGIFLVQACDYIRDKEKTADRMIVISDEQDCDLSANPDTAQPVGDKAYFINVAGYKNGIGYGRWTHVDGWSENTLRWIAALEAQQLAQ